MWKYLLEHSYRLRKIETVQLSSQPKPRIPPIQGPSETELNPNRGDKIDPDLIRSAFKSMQLLHAVIWDSEYGYFEETARVKELVRSVLDGVNRYCPTFGKLANLRQITSIIYDARCNLYYAPGHDSLSFLLSFPRLQHFTLLEGGSFSGSLHSVFSMKFPLLESLSVNGLYNATINDILEFLAAHPLLRMFKFGPSGGPRPPNTGTPAAYNVAPHLEILDFPGRLVQMLFQTSDSQPGCRRSLRRLRTTLALDTQGPPEDRAFLASIGPQLEELIMDDRHPPQWRCPDLGSALRILSSAFPNLRLLDFACAWIQRCSAPSGDARPKVHDWISVLSGFNHLVALTIPWTQGEDNGIMVQSSPSKRRHTTMAHFLNHCPRLRFLFCRPRWIHGEQEKFAILIGHKDDDIQLRGARLIDEGSVEDRKWAAYDGKAKDLADEVSAVVRAT
ncbi:hypothetical protein FRC01_000507 [Tulasnella sp. 417]|nr:hypothetical protein FRC01_000507 [Tulasnella sp. 417]